jgi:hypothetical protein
MDKIQHKRGVLQKVGESLYRYSSNRVYYARVKVDGKEIKRSLGTTDPSLARRNLAALKDELRQIDRSQGRITLEELAQRCLHAEVRKKGLGESLNLGSEKQIPWYPQMVPLRFGPRERSKRLSLLKKL